MEFLRHLKGRLRLGAVVLDLSPREYAKLILSQHSMIPIVPASIPEHSIWLSTPTLAISL